MIIEDDYDEKEYDVLLRYIIVGDIAVGKSCLLLQFTSNQFRQTHEITLGVEFAVKTIDINNQTVKLQIWDTAGEEAFQAITRSYYKGAICALLVYDISRRDSFEHCRKWLNEVKTYGEKNIFICLIGNKADLEQQRQITYEEGEVFAEENGLMFMEVSAKTAQNINDLFINSAKEIIEKYGNEIGKGRKVSLYIFIYVIYIYRE
jgi:small GTP-binding protein